MLMLHAYYTSVKIQSSLFLLRLSAPLSGHNYTIKMRSLKALVIDRNGWETLVQNVQLGDRKCSKAFSSLKGHLPNKRRQRGKREIDKEF